MTGVVDLSRSNSLTDPGADQTRARGASDVLKQACSTRSLLLEAKTKAVRLEQECAAVKNLVEGPQ
jgi:hypothetical protein